MSATDMKPFLAIVKSIEKTLTDISVAKAAPEAARKELASAVIGHENWDGYGIREIKNTDNLHKRAVEHVTEYLVADLTERKRIELAKLADELDDLRGQLVAEAERLRFDLVDDCREAREWCAA